MFTGIEETVVTIVSQYGLLALLVFMFLETSMIFPFVPSELVVPVVAAAFITGPVSFLAFVFVAMIGATAGSLFAYYVFDTVHQPLIDRYGTYIHVSEQDRVRASRWFRRWGESSVLWGRLLPVLRSIISIPAGMAGMNLGKFVVYSGIGSGLFAASVGALVFAGREVLPTQVILEWLMGVLDEGMDLLLSNPVFVVATGGLIVAALLLARNAWSLRRSS